MPDFRYYYSDHYASWYYDSNYRSEETAIEESTEKIDGAIACIMALDRAIRCGNTTSESVYDSRGLLVF